MRVLEVDAEYAVTGLPEEAHDLAPAGWIVPVFRLQGALHRHADIALRNGPARVGNGNTGRDLGRVDAKNIAGRAMQPDPAEIARHLVLVIVDRALLEINRDGIGGIVTLGLNLLLGDEGDVGIGILKQWMELAADGTGQLAPRAAP